MSPVDPVTQGAAAHLQAAASAGQHDSAGAKMFADLMKGAANELSGHGSAPSTHTPQQSQGSTTVDLMQQLEGMHDSSDPIKSQYVMMDVLGQRMEFLGKLHITVALSSGFTGIFKQLFNRHD